MSYKKIKSTVKKFANFNSLALKDLQNVEKYFDKNSEEIKIRREIISAIEDKNTEIRKRIASLKTQYDQYRIQNINPIYNNINDSNKFLNQYRLGLLSPTALFGDPVKWKDVNYKNTKDVIEVITAIGKQEILLKKYRNENPFKEYLNLKELEYPPSISDKKLFRFGGVSYNVYFESIDIGLIKSYIKKIYDAEDKRKDELEAYKARSAQNDIDTRKIAASFKTKYPLSRQLNTLQNCPYCNNFLDVNNAHLEHIYPVTKGGKSSAKNLVWICSSCNLKKGDKTLNTFIKLKKMNRDEIDRNLEFLGKEH